MSELFLKIFPNGASSNQLDMLRDKVYEIYGNPYTDRSNLVQWPVEIKLLISIKDALDMLSSCWCYSTMYNWNDKYYDEYKVRYVDAGGTADDFKACVDVELRHYRLASTIVRGVATDSEGVSYNSLRDRNEVANWEYLSNPNLPDYDISYSWKIVPLGVEGK